MGTEIIEPVGLRGRLTAAGAAGGSKTIGAFRSLRGPSVEDGARRETVEAEAAGAGVDLAGVEGTMTHGRGASMTSCASFLDIRRIMYQMKKTTRIRAATPPPIAPPRLAGSVDEVAL